MNVDRQLLLQRGFMNFQQYNKSLEDWSLEKQLIWLPSNLTVSIGILRKQNQLFPSGPVILTVFNAKCWGTNGHGDGMR